MTTLAVSTQMGPLTRDDREVTNQQSITHLTEAAASAQLPIIADGLLFVVATLVSRLVNRVFGTTVYSADPAADSIEVPDYYYPPSCCCL